MPWDLRAAIALPQTAFVTRSMRGRISMFRISARCPSRNSGTRARTPDEFRSHLLSTRSMQTLRSPSLTRLGKNATPVRGPASWWSSQPKLLGFCMLSSRDDPLRESDFLEKRPVRRLWSPLGWHPASQSPRARRARLRVFRTPRAPVAAPPSARSPQRRVRRLQHRCWLREGGLSGTHGASRTACTMCLAAVA